MSGVVRTMPPVIVSGFVNRKVQEIPSGSSDSLRNQADTASGAPWRSYAAEQGSRDCKP
jgi:hypothetical protein